MSDQFVVSAHAIVKGRIYHAEVYEYFNKMTKDISDKYSVSVSSTLIDPISAFEQDSDVLYKATVALKMAGFSMTEIDRIFAVFKCETIVLEDWS